MTSFRPAKQIAHHLTTKKCKHGMARDHLKKEGIAAITSIGTEKKYKSCLKIFLQWCIDNGHPTSNVTNDTIQIFLHEIANEVRQKTLDGYRQALSIIFTLKPSHIVSTVKTVLDHRAYTREQITFLEESSDERLKLSIQLASMSGLRAHELDTISRCDEMPEDKRDWLPGRFQGIPNATNFVVQGKGGLLRQIRVPIKLAEKLELHRLPKSMIITQRGIHYLKRYDIVGGHKFSQQFSRLSIREFGWSNGAHGLRHSYAQERMQYLQTHGHVWDDALKILSQELGHFSTTNTMAYLR